jgi:hypothetical protein
MDTVRFTYLLKTQLANLNPVFFTGITGTGWCHCPPARSLPVCCTFAAPWEVLHAWVVQPCTCGVPPQGRLSSCRTT